MATSAEREASFRAELRALLERYSADISLEDDGKPWYPGYYIAVSMDGRYTDDGDTIDEYTEFQL